MGMLIDPQWWLAPADAWSPSGLKPEIWLDGADASTVTFSQPGVVSGWQDKGVRKFLFNQTIAANQPRTDALNGVHAIKFDRNNKNWLRKANLQLNTYINTGTLVGVYQTNMIAATQVILSFFAGGMEVFAFSIFSVGGAESASIKRSYDHYMGAWTTVQSTYVKHAVTNLAAITYKTPPGTTSANTTAGVNLRLNGTDTSEAIFDYKENSEPISNSMPPGNIQVGGSNHGINGFSGMIGELIVFKEVLSTADLEQCEGYLAHKWKLEAELPTGHPYKAAAP